MFHVGVFTLFFFFFITFILMGHGTEVQAHIHGSGHGMQCGEVGSTKNTKVQTPNKKKVPNRGHRG
eukprot:NODE_6272_length_263_cov_11.485981_g6189_i0.p2 GENE.NODE_6272_length_263_cov_11.485981_g6189_i0~~NODE_6272_length_263_cov_11.485981_g6189_i0.p2  ORF type:complete len:66 (+),score=15.03 NODE_6272_length_263_cov_11.485981_g6189_i0:13-210(+)